MKAEKEERDSASVFVQDNQVQTHAKDTMNANTKLIDNDSDWPPYEMPVGKPSSDGPNADGPVRDTGSSAPNPRPASEQLVSVAIAPPIPAMPPTTLPNLYRPSAFPAFMSRSAVFGAFRAGHAGSHTGWLRAQGSYDVDFAGERLSMLDKRVWEALVAIAKDRQVDLSKPFKVTLAEIARGASVAGNGGVALASVWNCAVRLAATRLQVNLEGSRRAGSLLAGAMKSKREYRVQLDLGFAAAILGDDIQIDFPAGRRQALSTPLAQWLHDYLTSHEPAGFAFRLRHLRELCGYADEARHFPADLRAAMEELASNCPELVASWSMDESSKKSEAWKLSIERGADRPSALFPPSMKKIPPPPKPSNRKRRGGVAL